MKYAHLFFIFPFLIIAKENITWNDTEYQIIEQTEKKSARTAILIISPSENLDEYTQLSFTHGRWKLGKKVWEQYMNSHSKVDCYFIKSAKKRNDRLERAWIEGNTIYIYDEWYEKYTNDRILNKTIASIELLLPYYTHFFRTNINTFINLKSLNDYVENHSQSIFTGPIWQNEWYVLGYGILFSSDVGAHIANEYRRLEGEDVVSHNRSDDGVLTSLAIGIDPYTPVNNPFRCCDTLLPGIHQLMCKKSLGIHRVSEYGVYLLPLITYRIAKWCCDHAPQTIVLYRIREGFDITTLAKLYDYLLHKIYPEIQIEDIIEYSTTILIQ